MSSAKLSSKRVFTLVIAAVFLMLSCAPTYTAAMTPEQREFVDDQIRWYDPIVAGPTCSASGPAQQQAGKLSADDNLNQRLFVGVYDAATAKAILAEYNVGGIFLAKSGSQIDGGLKSSIKDIQTAAKIPLLIATDQEYTNSVNSLGLANGKKASDLAGMTDIQAEQAGSTMGKSLYELGINMDFAPVVDIQNGNNSVIGQNERGISSDPFVIANRARAFSKGLASQKVAPVIKHFPGHGNTTGDSHVTLVTTPPLSELERSDLIPFTNLAKESPMAIMIGHLKVPGLTENEPASTSGATYKYLRDNLGFTGLAITDELAGMVGAGPGSPGQRAANSINAGADMALFNVKDIATFKEYHAEIKSLVTGGDASRVIDQKGKFGLPIEQNTAAAAATTNASTVDASTMNIEERKQLIYQLLVGLGFSPQKAAAIWGNIRQEAGPGLDPKALEAKGSGTPGYTGHGLVQWSWSRWRTDYGDSKAEMRTPNAARKSDLTDFAPFPPKEDLDPNTLLGFAKKNNKPWYDLSLQIAFIKHEAEIGQGANKAKLASFMATNSTNVEELTLLWEEGFEGASLGSRNMPVRYAAANEAMTKYSTLPGIANLATATAGNPTACAQNANFSSTASAGGPTSGESPYTTRLLTVDRSKGMYGRNVWYINQGDPDLQNLPGYTGGSWSKCNCGPTSILVIRTSFENNPNINPVEVHDALRANGAVGSCGGLGTRVPFQEYLKEKGYITADIRARGNGNVTAADLDKARELLKDGYVLMGAVPNHYLTIYAADNEGNFYISDSGFSANMNGGDGIGKVTAEQIMNGGGGLTGGTASGFFELWGAKKVDQV